MADGGSVIFKFLGDDAGLKNTMNKIGGITKTALKGVAVGTAAVTTGFTALVKASVDARGEMEQLVGGAKKIFDEMDYKQIEEDARKAYKNMNLSAAEYISMMNHVGATFAATMGDQKGYEVAKRGMQAIADYASGTGESLSLLNDKYKLITRSAQSYASIADQFAGILPQTKQDFLEQAQAAGFLSEKYKSLTDVPLPEYQEAVTNMIELGIDKMGLLGNTAMETENTLTGSIAAMKASWQNFLSGQGSLGEVVDSASIAFDNILKIVDEAIPEITDQIVTHLPQLVELGIKFITSIGEGIEQHLPELMKTAGEIVGRIVDGIIDHLPEIIDASVDIIIEIIDTITDNLPKIVDTGVEIVKALGQGLIEAIPKIREKIPEIIEAIISEWIAHLPDYIKAGFDAVTSIGDGFTNAIPNVLSGLATVFLAIGKGLEEGFSVLIDRALNWGRELLENFSKGIMERLDNLKNTVMDVVNSIASYLHFSRPDVGPLRDYEKWMPDMIEGMANSLERSAPTLLSKIADLSDAMSMSPTLNGTVSNNPSVNVSIYQHYEQDPLGQMVSNIKTYSNGAKNDYNYGYGG